MKGGSAAGGAEGPFCSHFKVLLRDRTSKCSKESACPPQRRPSRAGWHSGQEPTRQEPTRDPGDVLLFSPSTADSCLPSRAVLGVGGRRPALGQRGSARHISSSVHSSREGAVAACGGRRWSNPSGIHRAQVPPAREAAPAPFKPGLAKEASGNSRPPAQRAALQTGSPHVTEELCWENHRGFQCFVPK